LALPLPPWPRRLVPEVFRSRLAQIPAAFHIAEENRRCTRAPSVLSLHLAARRRRLPQNCGLPSWGSLPLRCSSRQASTHRRSHPATSSVLPKSCCEQHFFSIPVVQHAQGSSVARTPSPRLACPACRACSISTASMGFFPSEV